MISEKRLKELVRAKKILDEKEKEMLSEKRLKELERVKKLLEENKIKIKDKAIATLLDKYVNKSDFTGMEVKRVAAKGIKEVKKQADKVQKMVSKLPKRVNPAFPKTLYVWREDMWSDGYFRAVDQLVLIPVEIAGKDIAVYNYEETGSFKLQVNYVRKVRKQEKKG